VLLLGTGTSLGAVICEVSDVTLCKDSPWAYGTRWCGARGATLCELAVPHDSAMDGLVVMEFLLYRRNVAGTFSDRALTCEAESTFECLEDGIRDHGRSYLGAVVLAGDSRHDARFTVTMPYGEVCSTIRIASGRPYWTALACGDLAPTRASNALEPGEVRFQEVPGTDLVLAVRLRDEAAFGYDSVTGTNGLRVFRFETPEPDLDGRPRRTLEDVLDLPRR